MAGMEAVMEFIFPRSSGRTEVTFTGSPRSEISRTDMLIADSRVYDLHRNLLPEASHIIKLPGGEESKTIHALELMWKRMAEAGIRRDSMVVVAGGGTICDIGAFAASTWKRGTGLTLVPTTLLAMVDASLGGKTAINTPGGKNQAGTFYPASGIVVSAAFLETLPPEEMLNGTAEALKTAVIGDRGILEHLREGRHMQAVKACMRVKGGIVFRDLEETGERMLLNLGHTAGHCIEAASGFTISHGAAVAMGIPVAAKMGGENSFAEEFSNTAKSLGISTEIPGNITFEMALEYLQADKKTSSVGRTWIIPRGWERCQAVQIDLQRERELLERAWR